MLHMWLQLHLFRHKMNQPNSLAHFNGISILSSKMHFAVKILWTFLPDTHLRKSIISSLVFIRNKHCRLAAVFSVTTTCQFHITSRHNSPVSDVTRTKNKTFPPQNASDTDWNLWMTSEVRTIRNNQANPERHHQQQQPRRKRFADKQEVVIQIAQSSLSVHGKEVTSASCVRELNSLTLRRSNVIFYDSWTLHVTHQHWLVPSLTW